MSTSELHDFGGSLTFKVSEYNDNVIRDLMSRPTHLIIQLQDMSAVDEYVGGFEHVILRMGNKEHDFTSAEVLDALYAARARVED